MGKKTIIILILLGVIGILFFILYLKFGIYLIPKKGESRVCTKEAKVCPDGSLITRIPPQCEFGLCQGEIGNIPIEARFNDKIVYTTIQSVNKQPLRLHCNTNGGVFNECGSSCGSKDEPCITVCAFTCEFSKEK